MKELELSLKDVKELMEAFSRNKIGSFKLQRGEFRLELECEKTDRSSSAADAGTKTAKTARTVVQTDDIPPEYDGHVVKAPIVGTFYAAPAPDKEPYVSVGSRVKKGDVLFIIESMKLMNEVTSDQDGTVSQILAENAQAVEYGQPILVIKN